MVEFFCLCEGVFVTRVFLIGDLKGGDIRFVKIMYMYIVLMKLYVVNICYIYFIKVVK